MSRLILVVDDSPTMRGMVSHALNEAGFTTKEAENGKDALIKLTMMEEGGAKPDVIVTDINMPEMDGIELVKEIRKLSAFKHVPVLVLTTDNTDEKERGREGGRSDRLVGEAVRLGIDPEGNTKGAASVNGDYSKFLQTFFEEVTEHLSVLESGLLTLEQNPDDVEVLYRIFRSVHTIKGAGPMFGFTTMSRFAHKVETLLDPLRNRKFSATRQIIDLLLESADCLNMLVEAAKNGTVIDENKTVLDLEARLETCVTATVPAPGQKAAPGPSAAALAPSAPVTSARQTYQIRWTPGEDLFERGLNPLKVFEEMGRLGTVTSCVLATSRLPDLADLDPERCYLSWTCTLETDYPREDIESIFEFTAPPGGLTITALSSSSPVAQPTQEPHPEPARSVIDEEDDPRLAEVFFGQKADSLGAILVEQKAVTPAQLAKALDRQETLRAKSKEQKTEGSMRIDTEKIDKLINLVGELVITQSMLSDLGARFEMNHLPVLLERLPQLERNTREIQERVMGIRMLPIGTRLQPLPPAGQRPVGESRQEDSTRPLRRRNRTGQDRHRIHRRSADAPRPKFGRSRAWNQPEERLADGKPEQGTIRLNAFHEGGNICITVEDDGRGLNRDKILAKAIK